MKEAKKMAVKRGLGDISSRFKKQKECGAEELRELGSALVGEQNLPRAFCPALEGAATHSEAKAVQNSDLFPREENESVIFSASGGFLEVVGWLDSRLDSFFFERCRAQPTGRVFPLPMSDLILKATFPTDPPRTLSCLRLLVLSLNSLNGEGLFAEERVSPFQKKVLGFLMENCRRVSNWTIEQAPADWASFFSTKSVDYRGEEILMAQPIEWENISPALPDEVGAVELSQVVELGSKHYVERFTDYLVPADDQVYTKPCPRGIMG
jgi:hypothetical protein